MSLWRFAQYSEEQTGICFKRLSKSGGDFVVHLLGSKWRAKK